MTGNFSNFPEASLYIHVPFCTKKCPYCHFFVQTDLEKNKHVFLNSLQKEWDIRASLLNQKKIVSIYFGGGTPSLLLPQEIERLLTMLYKNFNQISPNCEITLEANPETVTLSAMQDFSKAGINRVSVGIQSFDDSLLKVLGRTHGSYEAKKALECIHQAGITNLSIDLMYELPYQTLLTWEKSLVEVKTLPITHLSLYNLVFEPGTAFYKKKSSLLPNLPSDDDNLKMLSMAVDMLPLFGLKRYEISAFAKEGFHSIHNSGYWTARPFLGLGPSAFSYLEGRRFRNIANLKKYSTFLDNSTFPEDFEETLPFEEKQKELLAIELRLLKGVNLFNFQQKAGVLTPSLEGSIDILIEKNWLKKEGLRLFLTEEGLNFYDSVATELI